MEVMTVDKALKNGMIFKLKLKDFEVGDCYPKRQA